jgi:hypothetical protein
MKVAWRPHAWSAMPFRWSPTHLTLYNNAHTYTSHIDRERVAHFVASVTPPIQALTLHDIGDLGAEAYRGLRHLCVVDGDLWAVWQVDTAELRRWWRGIATCTQLETLRYPALRLVAGAFDGEVMPHPALRVLDIGEIECEQPECTFLQNLTELATVHMHEHRDAVSLLLSGLKLTRLTLSNTCWTALQLPVSLTLHTLELLDMTSEPNAPDAPTNAVAGYIAQMAPHLRALKVECGCYFQLPHDWSALSTLAQLETLDLENTEVDDDAAFVLPHLPSVTEYRGPRNTMCHHLYVNIKPPVPPTSFAPSSSTPAVCEAISESPVTDPPKSDVTVDRLSFVAPARGTNETAIEVVPTLRSASVAKPNVAAQHPAADGGGTKEPLIVFTPPPSPSLSPLPALDPDEYGLAFPNLTALYHREPYVARTVQKSDVRLARIRGDLVSGADTSTNTQLHLGNKRAFEVFCVNDVPPHPKLKSIHVGHNLLDRTDLELLFDVWLRDYPHLETIIGAEARLQVDTLGTLDLDLDAGQHICLGDPAE